MKRTLLLSLSLFAAVAAKAQDVKEKDVPEQVRNSFAKAYPQVKQVSWEKEAQNYEAEYKIGNMEQSVLIDPSGAILETEAEIPSSSLPAAVKDYIAKHYANEKIKEAARITDATGIVTYEAELSGKELIFNEKGLLLKEDKK